MLDPKLFRRIEAVWEKRDAPGLDAEQSRVVDLHYRSMIRAGARLDPAAKSRLSQITDGKWKVVSDYIK